MVSGAPLLADWIVQQRPGALLVGPDGESAQWVAQAAQRHGPGSMPCAPKSAMATAASPSHLPPAGRAGPGRWCCSTIWPALAIPWPRPRACCCRTGAASVDVAVTHALIAPDALAALHEAGRGLLLEHRLRGPFQQCRGHGAGPGRGLGAGGYRAGLIWETPFLTSCWRLLSKGRCHISLQTPQAAPRKSYSHAFDSLQRARAMGGLGFLGGGVNVSRIRPSVTTSLAIDAPMTQLANFFAHVLRSGSALCRLHHLHGRPDQGGDLGHVAGHDEGGGGVRCHLAVGLRRLFQQP